MYRGKKFNSRKETVAGEEYLGIKIFRFYIKCVRCGEEIAIKTDPQHGDYTVESGASRNFEPWKLRDEAEAAAAAERAAEEEGDVMKQLENKTMENKEQMDAIEALDELRSLNERRATIDAEQLLAASAAFHAQKPALQEEDQKLVESLFPEYDSSSSDDNSPAVKKLAMANATDGMFNFARYCCCN